MKKSKTSTTVMICSVFFVFFLIHQITLSSIARSLFPSSSSSPNSTKTQGKPPKLRTAQSWVPKSADVQIRPIAAASAEPSPRIICDRSDHRYDICTINGPITINPSSATIFMVSPSSSPHPNQKIRPYPRKWENQTMSKIKELTLITSTHKTHCQIQHQSPALVFSAGGYTGNFFHDFNDGFIPLFITVKTFFSNGNSPIFVSVNCRQWWLSKYATLLKRFSPFPVINLDTDTRTHCFPSATIGLISHGFMTIDPKLLPHSETFIQFRALLGSAYDSSPLLNTTRPERPRLVLVARTGNVGRVIRNQAGLEVLAKEVGFEVFVFEPSNRTSLNDAYNLINRSHAMLGVHGAALTHSLFLRPGSVLIQLVPIGVDWLGETCFGKPARDLKFEYMEYKIELNESSLIEKYGKDDLVLRNPKAVTKAAWSNTSKIYLKNQDVTVDLNRIGKYLREAYDKAMIFMEKEG